MSHNLERDPEDDPMSGTVPIEPIADEYDDFDDEEEDDLFDDEWDEELDEEEEE